MLLLTNQLNLSVFQAHSQVFYAPFLTLSVLMLQIQMHPIYFYHQLHLEYFHHGLQVTNAIKFLLRTNIQYHGQRYQQSALELDCQCQSEHATLEQ